MKFSQMPYVRPSADEVITKLTSLLERFKSAATLNAATGVYADIDAVMSNVSTLQSLCYIRHTLNTEDKFYSAEQDFWDENAPKLQGIIQEINLALLETPYRAELEREWGRVMFLNTEISLKTFSPEIIPLLEQENKLTTEYDKLLSGAKIEFGGKTLTLSQLSPYHQSENREVRRASYAARGEWFNGNKARLDTLFDELTALRTKIAKTLGYGSFTELGYYRMTRNCYTAEDVGKFREAVKKYIVPLAARIKSAQAARIGQERPDGKIALFDDPFEFPDGNAKPTGTPEEILAAGKKMYHELSPETAEFIDFMYDNELFDVLSLPGKSPGGYCIDIPDYKSEFIFANFNGTSGDVDVLTHEAGHAFAGYISRDVFPSDLRQYTNETAETHSMSMEFFTHPWMELYFGGAAKKYRYSHLTDMVTFIPYGVMVDEFQHIIYERPELTPEQRCEVWRKLEAEYRPWLDASETPFYCDGRRWQAQAHIYESPFYYIDYCLAETMALSFWAEDERNHADAWAKYRRFVGFAGTKTFTELIADSGMGSPFDESTLKTIAETAVAWLDGNEV